MEPGADALPKERTMKYLISALCVGLAVSFTTVSYAETATTPTTTTPKKTPAPRSAKSIECSKLADAKGLHGKERRVFRAKCKKGEPTT
jgi:hypothetical protein